MVKGNQNSYVEFYEIIDEVLRQYAVRTGLEQPVCTYLFQQAFRMRNEYISLRMKGESVCECKQFLIRRLLEFDTADKINNEEDLVTDYKSKLWYKSLSSLSSRLIFYIFNNRQLEYLLPLINSLNRPVLLICEPDVNAEVEINDNVSAIEICFWTNIKIYNNLLLENSFPDLYRYYNSFELLLEVLQPEGVIVWGGCHYQEQIISVLAQSKGIPTIAIQHGSPSYMHTLFRNMPFSHYLMKGNNLNQDWIDYNPHTQFISTDYYSHFDRAVPSNDAVKKTVDIVNRIVNCNYLKTSSLPCLHIGCGPFLLDGWLNTDILQYRKIYFLDAGKPYPFPNNSFDFIYSEHLFEHLDLKEGINMLLECFRILKPGGKMRLAMPNFHFLMELYLYPDKDINKKYLQWSFQHFVANNTLPEVMQQDMPVYVINNFFHAWGHQFIHTPEELSRTAIQIGFKNIHQFAIGESETQVFKSIEKHQNEIPEWANELETFIIEMEK